MKTTTTATTNAVPGTGTPIITPIATTTTMAPTTTPPPQCPNVFKTTLATATQIKASAFYKAKKTEKNWAVTLSLDKSVKALKVFLS